MNLEFRRFETIPENKRSRPNLGYFLSDFKSLTPAYDDLNTDVNISIFSDVSQAATT